MNNMIYAYWWYEENFGDALTPYLIKKLSGKRVVYTCWHRPYFKVETKRLFYCITHLKKYDFRRLCWPVKDKPVVMGVGSILWLSLPNYQIWGSGFLRTKDRFKGGEIYAVRGKYSAQKLIEMGYPECNVYGDPALLLPLIYTPKKKKKGLGIIPHYSEYEDFKKKYPNHNIINLKTYNIEKTIDDICSCEYILSTSLHGVIVAHAYGIPALWIKKKQLAIDDFKFKDYFSSIDIPEYDGSQFDLDKLLSMPYFDYPDHIKRLMLPSQKTIQEIQNKLLEVAPFKILDQYKNG